ncbi:DNA polymerase III subunit epsilon [Spirabiliibacterium falconis]|uniref:DNA polymerase III subunit epsilon n=1 Tax=Spirabiliibacterium falconis TaxID=572023 RepID=UPI001AAD72CE|nr:DNA polymerase III subunit epsilon [Spirabiliibacterium falconis]MBE2893652.1 DNA polymerase III subunit epsilon [Spirabiliibacterium falconis]
MAPTHPTRQVVLDTETTGMNTDAGKPHFEGHRIIEIGAVEMINRRLTGRTFHVYIKPDRSVDPDAVAVHGITDEMLADKPEFDEIADEFIAFIQDAELIIHNAPFDVGFLDYEFSKSQHQKVKQNKIADLCLVTDSLSMAKKKYPGKRNNLDALCDRLNIDNSSRTLHGALLDAEILADVYLKMTGGQFALFEEEQAQSSVKKTQSAVQLNKTYYDNLTVILPNDEERAAHDEYLKLLNKKSGDNCLWLKQIH